jgi:LAO/AO transport system kinase
LDDLGRRVLRGERTAVSRAISSLENRDEQSSALLSEIYPHTGRAFVLGVTGPPGTGKSSLVDRLVSAYRSRGRKVGVLAVDPSSPVSGGAILGDRVRMLEHALDAGVYIRSMASRGDEGGLSDAAQNAIRVLDAAGNDVVIVETVGIGQAEVQIVKVADAVLVVLMPELGDEIQANKAGLLEIGDIFLVNKSDLPGADKLLYNIASVLSRKDGWRQKVLKASAKTGEGLGELLRCLDEVEALSKTQNEPDARKLGKISDELLDSVSSVVLARLRSELESDQEFRRLVEKVARRELDPDAAARKLLDRLPQLRWEK